MSVFFLPVKLTKSKKCSRCTMRYKITFDTCPHCKEVADGGELEEHIENYQNTLKGNSNLGAVFLVISILIAVLLLLAK